MPRDKTSGPGEAALRLGLGALAGTLYFLGFAGFDLWWFAPVALVPLLEAIRRARTGRQAFAAGMVAGMVTHLGGYYWLVGTLRNFGGFSLPVALFFDAALCSWGALSFAILSWMLKRWWMAGGRPFPSAPIALVAIEHAYPLLFPSYLANSFWRFPVLIQVADIGGPLLLSAVVACFSTALWLLVRWKAAREPFPRAAVGTAAASVLAVAAYGLYRIDAVDAAQETAEPLRVGVVQVDMGTYQKREDPEEGHRRHIVDSLPLQEAGADLLVWPESALVGLVPHEPGSDVRDLVLRRPDVEGEVTTPTLFGALRMERRGGRDRYYNTAFLADAAGRIVASYDKTYLLAFGEYIPFGETFPWLYDMSPNSGRFTPGTRISALPFRGRRIGVMICYEDVLPGFVRKLMSAADPHLLVNVTNDAWFGDTVQPEIHLALSVFRAVEHRRWMVRATNSGVSAIVDPVGRVVARTGQMTRETILGTVRWLTGTTFYAVAGDWPGWLSLAGVAWAAFRMWRTGHLRLRRPRRDDGPGRLLPRRR